MKEFIKALIDVLPCIIPLILVFFGIFVYFKGGANEEQ